MKFTNLVKEETVYTPSNPTICLPLMCFVTKQQTVGVGQYSRRDWTVLSIFTFTGAITKLVLVIWMVNFGSDWTKFTAWPQIITACCVWIWKTLKGILLMLSITCSVLWVRMTCTSWTSAVTQVWILFYILCRSVKVLQVSQSLNRHGFIISIQALFISSRNSCKPLRKLSECVLFLTCALETFRCSVMDGCPFLDFVSQDQLVTLSLIIAAINFPLENKHAYHVPGLFTEPGGTIIVIGLTWMASIVTRIPALKVMVWTGYTGRDIATPSRGPRWKSDQWIFDRTFFHLVAHGQYRFLAIL